MVTVKKVSKNELPELIQIAYKDDQELFDKYHIAKFDYEESVNSTLSLVEGMSNVTRLDYYKVIFKKQPIGYVITFDNVLYSFGISIKFRTKDVLLNWWKEVKKILGNQFSCILYRNNERAISFLKRQGLKVLMENEQNNSVILINS